jgi:hypothetical protein
MSTLRLQYRPGIDFIDSPTASRGGWSISNNIRWRKGYPEKLRGWQRFSPGPLHGICRSLHFWYDLSTLPYLVCGTHSTLEIMSGMAGNPLQDITPAGLVPGEVSSGTKPYSLRIWSVDNFGQDLLACPSGGALYKWQPPNMATPASIISTAPPYSQGGFMTMPYRIMMMFGSSPDGATMMDPMLLRWCDVENYTSWLRTTSNFAGSYRLSRGSRIVGGLQCPLGIFLWTDLDVWNAQYEGFPLVFGFNQLESNCGLIGQKAVCVVGSVPYWMSPHGFFRMTGNGIEQIECTVWDAVFLNLDDANSDKCVAGFDYVYSTVIFFYPSKSGGTGEIDRYVQFNTMENLWDYGLVQRVRTAWTDQNWPGNPLGVDLGSVVQQENVGLDADGQTLTSSMRSAFNDLGDGRDMVFVERYIPDFLFIGDNPSLDLTFYLRNYPGDPVDQYIVRGPFTVTPHTKFIKIDGRGREWSEQIEVTAPNTFYRRGVPRAIVQPDGRL